MVGSPTLRTHPETLSHQSFAFFPSLDTRPKTRLERLFSVFADGRGEGISALRITARIFFLLGAYYLLKPVRETIAECCPEVKSYSATAQALPLFAMVLFYGWFATKVNRSRLLASMTVNHRIAIEHRRRTL